MTNWYLIWRRDAIDALPPEWEYLCTEVDEIGSVTREIAVDTSSRVVYKAPTAASPRLLFDLQTVQVHSPDAQMSAEAFERLWDSPLFE